MKFAQNATSKTASKRASGAYYWGGGGGVIFIITPRPYALFNQQFSFNPPLLYPPNAITDLFLPA
ncbi:MAG: hypothetical protein LBQ52_06790, partial [Helicobacteraceae bacterium]|nr:hypothetical protein [Helicobacteraceae bacterium]